MVLSSPALLLQGHAVDPAVGAEDVELPGLGQQLHVPHLVGAPVHGLRGGAEGRSPPAGPPQVPMGTCVLLGSPKITSN